MLKIYGIAVSNYFSMIKQVALEKGIPFEEVQASPSQNPEFLQKSPMGKVPLIETERGFLTESSVIIDYLEEVYPDVPLYPADPFERAKVKELMRVVELYVEGPAHSMVGILLGQEVPQAAREQNEPLLNRGLAALNRLVTFAPYIAGNRLTYADLSIFWSLFLAENVCRTIYQRDILEEVKGLGDWKQLMLDREHTSRLVEESRVLVEKFMSGAS